MLHAEGVVGGVESGQGAGGAEHGAHAAGAAEFRVDGDLAPEARGHGGGRGGAEGFQTVEEAQATLGYEVGEGTVSLHMGELGLATVLLRLSCGRGHGVP